MKIALIQCPSWTTESPPYALALLAAVLKKHGHEVTCFDLNIELYRFAKDAPKNNDGIINDESWSMDYKGSVWYEKENALNFINKNDTYINKLVDSIVHAPSQAIGFSIQSTSKFFSLEIAHRIKEKDKKKIIIFGGPLCFRNCYGIDILKDFSFIDFVCFGEGEVSLPGLLNMMEKGNLLTPHKGFGSRLKVDAIIDGGDDELIENLDAITFADYSGFDLSKYTKKILPVSTSRGCINRCSFCNESPQWRKYRRRSAQNILDEITYQLNNYPDTERFWFNDSLINGDVRVLNELCDLLISTGKKIKWGGQGMIRREMTRDLLEKMKLAGCEIISYGVENGSDKILGLMRKGYTAALAEKVIHDTFETDIKIIFNLIIGFPGETEREFKETKNFIQRCKKYASHVELGTLLLLKGSYLYNNLSEFNITPIEYSDPDWQLKWKTNDNQNTYDVRKERLEQLKKLIG